MCFDWLPFRLQWEDVKSLFNSAFFTSIAGALAGAFFGAYGAQKLAEKQKIREEWLKEIRNTNATIMIAYTICNGALNLKKQHVKGMKEKFDAQKLDLAAFKRKRETGEINLDVPFRVDMDFQTLPVAPLPIELLRTQVFGSLSLNGRPLSLTTVLEQTLHGMQTAIQKRNDLIAEYKALSPLPENVSVPLYFGLPSKEGHTNAEYPHTLMAIYNQTDDVIFFSHLLCKDLENHGADLVTRFKKKFGKGAPRVNHPDFSMAETAGLMPKSENYIDWLEGFVRQPDEPGLLKRIRNRFKK